MYQKFTRPSLGIWADFSLLRFFLFPSVLSFLVAIWLLHWLTQHIRQAEFIWACIKLPSASLSLQLVTFLLFSVAAEPYLLAFCHMVLWGGEERHERTLNPYTMKSEKLDTYMKKGKNLLKEALWPGAVTAELPLSVSGRNGQGHSTSRRALWCYNHTPRLAKQCHYQTPPTPISFVGVISLWK